ncbi:MAG TPA: BTAD domain-containing putative transcriptional regulator [Nocardioides sp.]|jgi:DNA-binding SARP family transcriptional activator/WD40 repeat protein|nr:BTAD domain-containing putative transcriptional regulator [Nocardioides sp.]
MGIAVLGPLQVDGQTEGFSPRDRVVLSALVVKAGETLTKESLADALWGEGLPASWTKVLQGCVVRLRKRLGSAAIRSAANGYRLDLTEEELDHRQFERLLDLAREAFAAGDFPRASYLVQDALQLWRGPALSDVEEWAPGRVEITRLEGLRMDAEELLVEAEIDAGRAREILERARALVARAPFRERRWALLARALHQSGRQPEALGAIARARAKLADELGLDPGRELVELETMLLRQDPSLAPAPTPVASAVCPYRGLLPFDAADADTFFGREDDVAACLRRLRDVRVLAVVGPSGVGKSSLVRAGVVASLARSGTPVHITTPGPHPMDSLVGLKPRGRQTLVVDQAEEAVTLCADPDERARYVAALAMHVGAGGALVLSLRADHLGDFAPYPQIARVLEEGLYLLGPLSEEGLRSAIEGPARRAGLRLEPGLVDLLVREVEGEPAALPLLSHVLRETWARREGPTLTVAGYRATGGIRQAVSRSAESVYDAMDATQRSQLRSLLLRLVMPTEDGDAVRARVPRAKVTVDPAHEQLVERLVAARLVTIDGDSVQIAHEALVRVWPRLRGWLDDDIEGQRLFRHLAGAADAWESLGRAESELYRGTRLVRALEWRDRARPDLNDTESAFLDASITLAAAEEHAAQAQAARERRARRRLHGALAGLGAVLVIALVAGILAVRAGDRAARDRERGQAAALLAEARRAGAQAASQENIATGLLLAVEALRGDESAQARDNLAATLTEAGPLRGVRDAGGLAVSMSASPEGSLLAVSPAPDADEPWVHLYQTPSLRPVEFADRTPPPSIVRFSPDGGQLAVAVNQWVEDRQKLEPRIDKLPLRLYDMPAGTLASQQLGGWPRGSSIEYALDFSDDGHRLAAVVQHYDLKTHEFTTLGTATVWDLAHPTRPVLRVPMPEGAQVALNEDGTRLFAAMKGTKPLRVYDVGTGRLVRWASRPGLRHVAPGDLELSPDGTTLAVSVEKRVLRLGARTLTPRSTSLRGDFVSAGDLDYSHDGRRIAATSDFSTTIWDAASGSPLHHFAAGGWATEWSPDGGFLYVQGNNDQLLALTVDPRGKFLTLGEDDAGTGRVSFDASLPGPEGHLLARMKSRRLWFVDTRTGDQTPRSRPVDIWGARWSPDSRRFLTFGSDSMLRVWEATSGEQVAHRPHLTDSLPVAFSSDGTRIYAPDGTGKLETLDSKTLRPVHVVSFRTGITSLQANPRDGSVLALMVDGSVVRLDPTTGEIGAEAPPGTLSPEKLTGVFSPDGSVLATADAAGNMRLLDAETLTWVSRDSGAAWGFDRDFAPDGSQVAAVVQDGVSLWDGHTGVYLATLPLPAGTGPVSIAYLEDSSGLVIAAADGRTWTADTRTSTWIDRACQIAGRNLTHAEWAQFFPRRNYHATCPAWPAPG